MYVHNDLLIYYLHTYIGIIHHPANNSYCEEADATLNCVVFDNTTNNAADTIIWFKIDNPPLRLMDDIISNSREGDVLTTVLTIENVSLSDNGNGYFCEPVRDVESFIGVLSVIGEYNICLYIIYT